MLGLGAWLGVGAATFAMASGPVIAVAVARSHRQGKPAAIDACILFLFFIGAAGSVPMLYNIRYEVWHRPESAEAWGAMTLLFAGAPLWTGVLRAQPTPLATCAAAVLATNAARFYGPSPFVSWAAAVVYVIFARRELPAAFDSMPEIIYLASGSIVTFVSSGWAVRFAKSGRWIRILCAFPFLCTGIVWAAFDSWLIIYFE